MDSIRTLNNSITMPTIGFGTYLLHGQLAYDAAAAALRVGYRHLDTAAAYENEEYVGRAVRDSGLPRDEIFVTTKLWNEDIRRGEARQAFEASRRRLGLDYVDLYLIHWPADGYVEAWKVLEELYAKGAVKAIGVSNFQRRHLETLLAKAAAIPAVNQIECHPYLAQRELRAFCGKLDILCESWSPLGGEGGDLLSDGTLGDIAHKHGRSPAQIVLRWLVQIGLSVNPKSAHAERIRENLAVFDFNLDADDIRRIDGLNRDKRFGPDPDNFDF